MVTGEKLIEKINREIESLNLDYDIVVKGKNGLNNIVLFNEPDLFQRIFLLKIFNNVRLLK